MLVACADTAGGGPETYVVGPGDTLYSIAWRHDLDFRDLARWNNIGPDFRIAIGQVLVLGAGWAPPPERGTPRAAPPKPVTVKPLAMPPVQPPAPPPQVGKPRPLPEPAALGAPNPVAPNPVAPHPGAPNSSAPNPRGAASPPNAANGALNWVWPTDRVGMPRAVPGGGILLSGRLGQDVRAASAGRVVYTGSGLRGYGNLVIIKHADSVLSAYAHNREMLVRDGQEVAAGQVIAHMGEGAHQAPVLYFEIRQNGKPVDPILFLPTIK